MRREGPSHDGKGEGLREDGAGSRTGKEVEGRMGIENRTEQRKQELTFK